MAKPKLRYASTDRIAVPTKAERQQWASHYHRCKSCGGFVACEQSNPNACIIFMARVVEKDCNLGIDGLAFEARHSSIRVSLYEIAANRVNL